MPRVRWSRTFEKSFRKLPAQIQDAAFRAVQNFLEAPERRSLNFEKLRGTDYWSIRVNLGYRILLRSEPDPEGYVFRLMDIGPHDVYRRI
jgi:mRNA-degrading endonuclease RelE of RelBE toxin-antitoxin system